MTLYHPTGDSFELTAREWLNLLAHASCYGWQPGNPQPAVIHFDLDDPDMPLDDQSSTTLRLETASGQIMSAPDARRLASAWRKGKPPEGMDLVWLSRLCGFCESGFSLLLSDNPPLPSASKTSPLPVPMESQLINLSYSLSNEQSSRPTAEPVAMESSLATRDLEVAHQR